MEQELLEVEAEAVSQSRPAVLFLLRLAVVASFAYQASSTAVELFSKFRVAHPLLALVPMEVRSFG